MARQIYSFAVSVATGTTPTTPQVSHLTIPSLAVEALEIRVPPGPAGNVGFAIGVSGQPIIPYNAGQWIVTDDEVINWPLDGYPESGAWTMTAYNVGTYAHTVYVRMLTVLPSLPVPVRPSPLPAGLLVPSLVVPSL